MPLPICDFCQSPATYDSLCRDEQWRYLCNKHWLEHRASEELGPGKAQRLHRSRSEIERDWPVVVLAKPEAELPKPEVRRSSSGHRADENGKRLPNKVLGTRAPRTKDLVFTDMEPISEKQPKKEPKPGSTLAIALELGNRGDGFTMEELQEALGPKHHAIKLLIFMHDERGYGWRMDPETKRIKVVM